MGLQACRSADPGKDDQRGWEIVILNYRFIYGV
jgi:hypothetical protein